LVFAAVALPAAAAAAQPPAAEPPPYPLPAPTDKAAAQRAKLQAELLAALRRLGTAPAPAPPAPAPKIKLETPVIPGGPDPVREGMNLFRDNDFEAARRVFQLIEPTSLPREDRVFVRYMLASCLRREGRLAEAEPIYREVANSGEDEFLTSCAIWQLSLIRSERDLQAQLAQLRARAKSR
jgi:hypothetical protein